MPSTHTYAATRSRPGQPDAPGEEEVVVEEALEIRVEGQPAALTMRTPGDDLDLAAGFLWTEGVIDGPDDLRALAPVAENVVDAVLAEGVPAGRARRADRFRLTSSACGLCARDTLHALPRPPSGLAGWSPAPEVLATLPAALSRVQPLFAATGGLHAAALFDSSGAILLAREDVGRHNAVDKVLGARLRADALPLAGLGLLVSSRAGFEIVSKAAAAGVGLVVAVGAPSSLAVDAARTSGMHLWAWARGDRSTRYA